FSEAIARTEGGSPQLLCRPRCGDDAPSRDFTVSDASQRKRCCHCRRNKYSSVGPSPVGCKGHRYDEGGLVSAGDWAAKRNRAKAHQNKRLLDPRVSTVITVLTITSLAAVFSSRVRFSHPAAFDNELAR